ncbi:MAG: MBL fold metallo-hydrolase [Gemmatimonadetes bacterium]|nr:MBL fold metallo-hydrolase [Gemmatimonadota bacterium]
MKTLLLAVLPLIPFEKPLDTVEPSAHPTHDGEIRVTILFDNYAADERLRTGWGFAALLETPDHTILFDTGADGEALLENFRLLGKDPMEVEAIVISHAHGDHTGGMQALFDLGLRPSLYLLEGFPEEMRSSAAASLTMIEASPGQEIAPGIRTTGQLGTDIPEQALILDTQDGIVLLTGCAHPGVVQMIEGAQAVSARPLHLVMGGFHLMNASGAELEVILGDFRRLGVEQVGATHCSGDLTMSTFQAAYGESFRPLGAGRTLSFPLPS